MVAWAKAIAVKCQLRITEIQLEAKARKQGQPKKEFTDTGNFVSAPQKLWESERRTVANNMTKEELDGELAKGNHDVRELAEIARKKKGSTEVHPRTTRLRQSALLPAQSQGTEET